MSIVRNIARQERALEHAEWVEADGDLVERYRQAAAAERSDAFDPPEFPDMPQYLNAVCKGSLQLGNACRRCERCLDELKKLAAAGPGPIYAEKPVVPHPSGDAPLVNPHVHQGLPVAGYKKEQPAWAVALVNQHKVLEEALQRHLDHLKVKYSADVDQRQVALARTKLEEAFYHMNRAVFQPQRLDGPEANAILRAAGSRAGLSVDELLS